MVGRFANSTAKALMVLAALCLLVACEEDSGATNADATITDTATVDATGSDTAAVSDVAQTSDVLAGTDAVADIAPAGKSCGQLLPCALACAQNDATCIDTCAKNGNAAAKTALGELASCAASLCDDVTQTSAYTACVMGGCWSKVSACAGWSAGEETCAQTVGCLGRCSFSDRDCQSACLQRSAGSEQAGAWMACAHTACASAAPAEWAACAAAACGTELSACAPSGADCVAHSACLARCPASLPNKPNACRGVCDLVALPEAASAATAYETCKTQCDGVLDANCVAKQCKAQKEACYGAQDSGKTCVEVYECLKSQCNGIGGSDPCVFGCLDGASANATEAFVGYEGCVQVALGESQAATVGCSFPYDEKTCISVLNGFCGKPHSGCFKPN